MDIKAVVFDFGGVLMDWNPRYLFDRFFPDNPAATRNFLDEIGFDKFNLRLDQGLPFAAGIAELTGRFPAYRELLAAYDTCWEETVGGSIPATVAILDELKDAGIPLFGLSNWSAEKFAIVRPKYEFFNWFTAIVISGEVKQVKPEPEIFRTLLHTAGYRAGQCLFVDDSAANIAAARELGFETVHFRSPEQLRAALGEKGINLQKS